jgi:hypothetical protein
MLTSLLLALLSGGSDAVALERALGSVKPAAIRSDLFFIASDELEGRDTPSPGQRLAARFIRARLERLGWQPMGEVQADGTRSFFDEYRLTSTALDPAQSGLEILRGGTKRVLAPGEDYYFWGDVKDLELGGGVVYLGTGSKADYEGQDLAGSWALVTMSETVKWRDRSRNAAESGALGLLVAPDPNSNEAEWWRGSKIQRTSVEGNEQGGGGQPQLWLSAAGAAALLDGATPKSGTKLDLTVTERRKPGPETHETLENVAGFWPGSDPVLAKEVIIVSAHYDHVGKPGGVIHNGADDNGSGTCGLLALAEALKSYGPLRRSVLLLWVSGEEKGLWGSAAWTKKPTLAEGVRAVCDLNIDMIGRNAPDYLLITPTSAMQQYNGLTKLAEKHGPSEGFPKLGSADEYWGRSDHANFSQNLGIPVAFLFSDVHDDYHEPGDDPEKIDYDKLSRVVRLVLRMLDELQGDSLGV